MRRSGSSDVPCECTLAEGNYLAGTLPDLQTQRLQIVMFVHEALFMFTPQG